MTPEPETPIPPTEPAPAKPLPHLFIATPCYGGLAHLAYYSGIHKVMAAAKEQGVEVTLWQQGGESHINRARNSAVAAFLKSKATHLFFIDSDISFETEDFQKVISVAHAEDLDVVAGAYPIKEIMWDKALAAMGAGREPQKEASRIVVHRLDVEHDSKGYVDGIGECIEVKECGTGFMCISRRCLESMIDKHRSDIEYTTDRTPVEKQWNVFHSGIKPDIFMGEPCRRWLSEDYWFCRTWREMGGKVWLHLGVNLGHYGMYEHRGNPHEIHGGPKQGLKAKPEHRERVMAVLQGSMLPGTEPPAMVVDYEAKEGAFALNVGLKYPQTVFDLYEPDDELRMMLKENFAVYGLRGQVHDTIPTCSYAKPYWNVRDGKVEVIT